MKRENKIIELKNSLKSLRSLWTETRSGRLNYRDELMKKGNARLDVRKDKYYRKLKKEQKRISVKIKHLERDINRRAAASNEKK